MSETIKVFGDDGFEDPSQSDLNKLSDLPDSRKAAGVEKAESTQQDSDERVATLGYYVPPKDPHQLLSLLEKSETHQACVSAKSKGVAGHGFDLVPHQTVDADDVGETPDALDEFWHKGTFQLGPGAIHASASEVLESAWNDLESMGYLAIEVLTNPLDGTPTGLAHVPAQDIRKRDDKPGYVELDSTGQLNSYYAPAGTRYDEESPTFVDADTGDVADSARGVETVANELVVIRNYSALAPHYGLPDIVPGIKTVAGDLASREYNRTFFSNNTVPRMAVIVEGGELTDKSWDDLRKTLKNLRNQENTHRGVLLETTSTVETQLGEATGANIRIEPLGVGVQEDAGFIEYRDNNEHYILQAHEVPPVVAGRTEDVNRSTAKSQRVNFAQETIAPKQERYAARLYQVLHVQAFDEPDWTIDFALHGGENNLRQSEILSNKASAVQAAGKVLTANEVRSEFFDLPPIEDVDGEPLSQANAPDIAPDQQPPGTDEENQPPNDDQQTEASAPLEKADWGEGDVVEPSDGELGVVLETHSSDFDAPTESGETIEVADGETIVVVALESGGFDYFAASELSAGEIPDSEQADTDEVDEEKLLKARFEMPDGWTRLTMLDAWQSMGGTFRGCMGTLHDNEMCASLKDTVYGTTHWR